MQTVHILEIEYLFDYESYHKTENYVFSTKEYCRDYLVEYILKKLCSKNLKPIKDSYIISFINNHPEYFDKLVYNGFEYPKISLKEGTLPKDIPDEILQSLYEFSKEDTYHIYWIWNIKEYPIDNP